MCGTNRLEGLTYTKIDRQWVPIQTPKKYMIDSYDITVLSSTAMQPETVDAGLLSTMGCHCHMLSSHHAHLLLISGV